ncbi:tetratricopeptide repeat protein [Aurantiacibacter sp. D1-12]|uniref:tetratricopeptide repeat protein n=1 Tax=Aurantiacibacter sp. D1-12 TaxID=2993658 RepID=UPI00237CD753|nr:tetratricopeptide repeat protein [Aurantiacibacter sp. D1-12]MDE1467285.1 tetratricopeptide repeat protein [Aurantiacibacter sp. D1-12]
MAALRKGTVGAIIGIALLAGVVGWRTIGTSDTASEAEGDRAGMSLPPTLEQMAARAEADPDNALLWQEYGLALFNSGRFAEAADAYESAVEADTDTAILWSSLGEARVMASESDPMPQAAERAFRRALELDPTDPRARYFLAVARDLTGDHEGAITDWLALLADTPPGAPWETDLVRTIQQVGAINEIEVEQRIASAAGTRDLLPAEMTGGMPGPTQEQMAAAASIAPDEQQSMAEGMVARLAARIEAEGGTVEEWVMLMRSYNQLGRTGDARRARDAAISAHPDAREQIENMAATLGIE